MHLEQRERQDLRRAGRIRAAIERFEACAATACPSPLREDCAERLAEARRAAPTIVFVAKDAAGNALTDVKVAMDGAPMAERLDGAPLVVEPGEHTFELTAVGYVAATTKLVVHEGRKERAETVVLTSVAQRMTFDPQTSMPAAENVKDGSTQRTLAYVAGGLGVAGLGIGAAFGLLANGDHSNALGACHDPSRCTNANAVTEGNRAKDEAMIANIGLIAGGVVLAGSVVLYLTAPKDRRVAVALERTGIRLTGWW